MATPDVPLLSALLLGLLLGLAILNMRSRIFPNRVMYPAIAFALLWRAVVSPEPIWESLAGGAFGLLWFMGVNAVTSRLAAAIALGGGDLKVQVLVGIVFGWSPKLGFYLSFVSAAVIVAFIIAASRKADREVPSGWIYFAAASTAILLLP